MLRVPGSEKDLLTVKSAGGDVRIVYSPMDAVALAAQNPQRQVVFFAVGFETTAPANAMAVVQAAKRGLDNFSVLVSHVLVPPAMLAVLRSPANQVQGFLAAGHVCTITGMDEYRPIAREFHVPIVITGFEPLDILQGILMCVEQLEAGRAEVANQYARSVRPRATSRRSSRFTRSSSRWRGSGGGSARFPPAAWPSARPTGSSTPSAASASRRSWPQSRPSALPARCCKAIRSRTTARPSASTARPSGRWGADGLGRRGLRGLLSIPENKGPGTRTRGQ